MNSWRLYGVLVAFVAAIVLASCGGGTVTQALDSGSDSTDSTVMDGTESTTTSASGWDALPAIPLDTDEERSASEANKLPPPDASGQQVILGTEYLQMAYGTEDGTSLVLESAAQTDGENDITQLAYGLYKLPGGTGVRPLALNIECVPAALDDAYFVGVADYTDAKWAWFGPINLPEYQLDLREVSHQLATHLGNMYFIIVCPSGTGATHIQTTATWGAPRPGDRPGFPHHLVASDGQFAEEVHLNWVAGGNASTYKVFRKPVLGDRDWENIGETSETAYVDSPLPDYKMFFYCVRAINDNGDSCHSNVDSGFAGGGDDPFVIRVQVDIDGEPIAGVDAGLAGFGEILGHKRTNENGIVWFSDLAPGRYLIALHHPGLEFTPEYQVVEFTADSAKLKEIHFNAGVTEVFNQVYGFVITRPSEDEAGGTTPVPGVTIVASLDSDPETVFTTTTDEEGYYAFAGLAEGHYTLVPALEGWTFNPPSHEVLINGNERPDRRIFLAVPAGDES